MKKTVKLNENVLKGMIKQVLKEHYMADEMLSGLFNELSEIDNTIRSYCSNPEMTEVGPSYDNLVRAAKEFSKVFGEFISEREDY